MVSTWSLSSQCGWPEVDWPKLLHGRAQPAWSLEILTSLLSPLQGGLRNPLWLPKASLRILVHQCQSFHESAARHKKATQKEECVFHKIQFIHVKHSFIFFLLFKMKLFFLLWNYSDGRLYMLFTLCSLLGKLISGPRLIFEISLILEIKCGGHCFKVCERDETSGISHYTNEAAMFIPEERKLLSYLEGLEIWGISPRFTFWILILSLLFNCDSTGLKEKLSLLVLKIQNFSKPKTHLEILKFNF